MTEVGLEIDGTLRAEKFIHEVLETDSVFYLKNDQFAQDSESNHYQDEDGNPAPVIPFWSKKFIPYAKKWSPGLEVKEISLKSFVTEWLNGMNEDGIIVGLNWDQNGIGYECTASSLFEEIKKVFLEIE